jgi:peptidoglycan/xylan/chitin deacetylase (PgdA/CDA1 family)
MTRRYFGRKHPSSCIEVKSITLIVCMVLLANIMMTYSPQRAQAAAAAKCNCVVFRLDDIQDYFVDSDQVALIDHFIANHQKLSAVAIMNAVGNDTTIVNEVKKGLNSGTLEIGSHAWDHVDYSKLPASTQLNTLQKSKQKIIQLWGVTPNVFVPPYDAYNNDTLFALKSVGFKVISAEFDLEIPNIYDPDNPNSPNNKVYKGIPNSDIKDSYGVYHLPQAIGFYTYGASKSSQGSIIKTPIKTIESKIDRNIAAYGYAVVTLHPDEFAVNFKNGAPQNKVSAHAMAGLDRLFSYINSKGYTTKTFSEVVGLDTGPSTSAIKDSVHILTWKF